VDGATKEEVMNGPRPTIYSLVVLALFITLFFVAKNRDNGIIVMEGYPEAVAFCQDSSGQYRYDLVVTEAGDSMFAEGGIEYIVNKGHLEDEEMADLVELARQMCRLLAWEVTS
jgi:hypothetical protein